ncbi:hypothetical protein N665_0067s0021 [Sinapis alba]|nr:hypothetical protein N665_0067s0021 [Sinapis alba]
MSIPPNPLSAPVPDSVDLSRRRGTFGKWIPKICRCGEKAILRTSGTARNPGRLFFCCPNGSEGEKNHLFTWADERVLEEVENLNQVVCEVSGQIYELRAELSAIQRVRNCCCAIW